LWLPVFFGAGIGVYFALTVEPPLWLGLGATIAAGGLTFGLHRRPLACEATLALTLFCAGFALIGETTWERQAPMLQRRLGPVSFTGRVIDIDSLDRGWRVIVAPDALPGLDPGDQPLRLRVHIAATSDLLAPGDRVSMRAVLYPVPGQIVPGGHDMQREAYFARIGGVGYTYTPHIVLPTQKMGQAAAGARKCGICAPRCRAGSSPCCLARPAASRRR
jgi:competence protein ComEC